jgi:ribose/xylose/arabinose/galactoside ABC-type transport system permease subunit
LQASRLAAVRASLRSAFNFPRIGAHYRRTIKGVIIVAGAIVQQYRYGTGGRGSVDGK